MVCGLGFWMTELPLPWSNELARVPHSRTKPLDLSLYVKKKKKVCNQYSDILIANRIRSVTKGFQQDD